MPANSLFCGRYVCVCMYVYHPLVTSSLTSPPFSSSASLPALWYVDCYYPPIRNLTPFGVYISSTGLIFCDECNGYSLMLPDVDSFEPVRCVRDAIKNHLIPVPLLLLEASGASATLSNTTSSLLSILLLPTQPLLFLFHLPFPLLHNEQHHKRRCRQI